MCCGFLQNSKFGAIFIDPVQQNECYGKQTMTMIEKLHPKIKRWKLETSDKNYELHKFYEKLGYIKIDEIKDAKSGMGGFIYEKIIQ